MENGNLKQCRILIKFLYFRMGELKEKKKNKKNKKNCQKTDNPS